MKNLFLLISAISINVMAFGQCQANFTSSVGNPIVSFTNTSVGFNVGYSWDFGDGNTSSLSNPDHVYSATGTYNVCLTIYSLDSLNGTCQDTYCAPISAIGDSTSGSNGCDAVASFDVNANGTITGTATSTSAFGYSWTVYNGSTYLYSSSTNPLSYNPGTPGVYTICLSSYDSLQGVCDSICYYVATDSTAGLNSLEQISLNVFPNPANDVINIATSDRSISVISLLNISGVVVREVIVTDELTQIELQNLPQGMYFIHALGREGQQLSSCKILKN